MSRFGGWRPALRIARRDLVRSKGRNALVVVMVGLPVLAVSTFATVYETDALSPVEQLSQQMGTTQAVVTPTQHLAIDQEPNGSWAPVETASGEPVPGSDAPWTTDEVRQALGGRLVDVTSSGGTVRTAKGRISVHVVGADAAAPELTGYVDLRSGRFPATDDEVLVSPWLAAHGFPVGHDIEVVDGVTADAQGASAQVVGTATVPSAYDDAVVVARPTSRAVEVADGDVQHTYLVPGPSPVTWPRVRELNALGLAVVSRSVVEQPPTDWQSTLSNPQAFEWQQSNGAERAVLVLVIFSVVLEVILLAGPAFAVGVRRQRRALALIAATGGTARDVRRVVLAQALATGALASVVGAALGLPVAAAIVWALPRLRPQTSLGPFDVAWVPVLVAAALGAVAALTAAYVPARSAARQDVVAVLAGRRGQVRTRLGLPLLGGVLLAAGAAVALVRGTRQGGEFWVAGGTLTMVLGAIALMPAVIGGVGRLGRRLPLALRLATRDSARQRGRTAPAVAAVMAAVAGITTLAIGVSSDFAQSRAEYQPRQAAGVTTVQVSDVDPSWWAAAARTTESVAPGRQLLGTGVLGQQLSTGQWQQGVYVAPKGCSATPPEVAEASDDRCNSWQTAGLAELPNAYGGSSSLVAEPAALEGLGYELDDEQRSVLRRGGVLLPNAALTDGKGHADLVTYELSYGATAASVREVRTHHVPAAALAPRRSGGNLDLVGAILTPKAAEALGVGWQQTGGVLSPAASPLSRDAQDRLEEVLLGSAQYVEVYTERGFDESLTLPLLGLVGIAALAVLVGTLTATGLALVDSRPDAATLAAIGAKPRTRRSMAAAQAVVIGLLGSLAGIAVGVVPGIAVTWPLTANASNPVTGEQTWGSPTIAVPWVLLLCIGVAVPVLAAVVAGLGTRSRMPLTRRLGQ